MAMFDEVGCSKGETLKLAHTKLNRVDRHTTLCTGQKLEPAEIDTAGDDSETDASQRTEPPVFHRPSYYGHVRSGPAARSDFNEKEFAAVLAFAVPEKVGGLHNSTVLTTFELNPPSVLLTATELEGYNAELTVRRKHDSALSPPDHSKKFVLSAPSGFVNTGVRDDLVFESKYRRHWRHEQDPHKGQAKSEPCYRPDNIETLARKGPASAALYDAALDYSAARIFTGGGKSHRPTNKEVIRGAHLIAESYKETYLPLSTSKLEYMRNRMRFEWDWQIGVTRLRTLLMSRHRIVSFGEIPVHAYWVAQVEHEEKQYQDTIALPILNVSKHGSREIEPQRKRLAAPRTSIFEQLMHREDFKQKENTYAEIIFHEDSHDRSYIRLRTDHQYKNESHPKKQPCHTAQIELTYRNTRPRGQLPPSDTADDYVPTERIINVTNPASIPLLQKLFPHLTRDNKKYWQHCYMSLRSGHQLMLLVFRQNKLPFTSNLFTTRQNMPPSYDDLRVVMRNAPVVFALVRGTDINLITKSIMNRFSELAKYNPLSKFFIDKCVPYINHKNIKKTSDLPKFTVLPKNSFKVWNKAAVHFSVGGILKHRFGMQQQVHRGKASAHPVPHIQYNRYDMALLLNFTEERADHETPRLTAGDAVRIDFNKHICDFASEHAWSGKVVAPTLSTEIGQVCLIANRPMRQKAGILDKKRYTSVSAEEVDVMTTEQLQAWSRDNRNLLITIFKDNNGNECERLSNGLDRMKVPLKSIDIFAGKEHILSQLRLLIQCKDHTQYDTSSLYQNIHPDDLEKFDDFLRLTLLKDYQCDVVDFWSKRGLLANIAILGGISGSGKTFTSISTLCGYLFRNRIDNDKRNMQLHEYAILVDDPSLAPAAPAYPPVEPPPDAWDTAASAGAVTDDFQSETWLMEDTSAGAVLETMSPVDHVASRDRPVDARGNQNNTGFIPKATLEAGSSAPSIKFKEVYEDGRITHCCIQNETVNHSYETFCKILPSVCEAIGVPMKLIIRMHSVQTEQEALLAMMESSLKLDTRSDARLLRHDPHLKGNNSMVLLEHYLQQNRCEYPGITDKRFRAIQRSVA
ncbi:hypothetical protein ACN47E_001526 [Coniothyrium glycines]